MGVLRWLQAWMLLFGIGMGMVFPVYAGFFVDFKPGMRTWFTIGCVVAGVMVGVFAYAIVRAVLLRELRRLVVGRLSGGAENVRSTSHHVFGLSQTLASSVDQQASALEQSSSAAEELTEMVSKNDESVSSARVIAGNSRNAAQRGQSAIQKMVLAIEEMGKSTSDIFSELEKNNQDVANLAQLVSGIGEKTQVINEIVFQTKLLSFNASVEAARAGDAGKGFATVAEEIGNLARMSGGAAEEISALLERNIEEVESVVKRTKQKIDNLVALSRDKIAHTKEIARECENLLNDLVKLTGNVDQTVSDIGNASSQQSKGIVEISRAIHELETANQQNSAVSRQSADSAKLLSGQAEELRGIVKDFVQLIEPSPSRGSELRDGLSWSDGNNGREKTGSGRGRLHGTPHALEHQEGLQEPLEP